MKVRIMGVSVLFHVVIILVLVKSGEAAARTKVFLINCGTNSSVSVEGRRWVGDLAPGSNIVTTSSPGFEASASMFLGDSVSEPLYKTARIFSNTLNYTFEGLSEGNYFMRLHFYPFYLDNYNFNDSSFDIEANGLKLVSQFNPSGEIAHKNSYLQKSGSNSSVSSVLIKEYFFAVDGTAIVVDFNPTEGSFGFVNAIEIVPAANVLFLDLVRKVGGNGAMSNSLNLSKRGIETMYRLNVGGSGISPDQDLDLWRRWVPDSSYMINADAGYEIRNKSNVTYASVNETAVAPLLVYETARTMSNTQVVEKRINMSWKFEVDPDFDYLIRLHFCELEYEGANQRLFRIYINNQTAADNFDIFARARGMNKAYYEDYYDVASSRTDNLWVQLGPDTTTGPTGTDALLNGLEIFKLSRNRNLAHVERYGNPGDGKSSNTLILWAGVGGGLASIASLAVVVLLVVYFYRNKRNKQSDSKILPGWRPLFLNGVLASSTSNAKGSAGYQNPNGSVLPVGSGRRFTFAEIRAATKCFDESLVIGIGGFGKVFKGELDDGTLAAIKRANPQSQQGLAEFETEIEMLSKLRHRHLVSMIGFCDEQNEMILVYEYMANGTLRSHLFGTDLPPLSWKQRLEVCIGSARGLHYLHTGSDRGIIHRDVKTTNILLDEDFVAKMADFGLSKTGPAFEHTHVSTAVKGSFGYLDPEYFRRQQLTERSDVYSFGVVLFEVVCARAVINPTLPKDQINLAEWAMRWQRQRSLETIIDPQLEGKYCLESLMKFGEIAEKCLADEGKSRPTMGEVLWHLEYVLQVHEAWLQQHQDHYSSGHDMGILEEKEADKEQVAVNEIDGAHSDPRTKQYVESAANLETKEGDSDAMVVGVDEFSLIVNQQGR